MQVSTKINPHTDPFWSVLDEFDRISVALTCKSMFERMNQCRLFDRFVDFSSQAVLKKYVASEFRSDDEFLCACKVIARIYQTTRSIKDAQYGRAFPMDSEVMAYAMENATNKNILEIAGAGGENSIMMAFGGAKQVYYNDISNQEVDAFKELHSSLPRKIQQKLEIIDGSCFDILKKKPKLADEIDLVICRNLIHFFNGEELEKFFDVVKKVLKVGGQIILNVNSKAALLAGIDDYHENSPADFSFKTIQCLVTDYSQGTMPASILYRSAHACPTDQISTDYEQIYMYLRKNSTQGKWKAFPDASGREDFAKIEEPVRKKITTAFEKDKQNISKIQSGSVRVLMSTFCAYSKYALRQLFRAHGFKVESTFITSNNGHLADNYAGGGQIGIIATRKS